ncbi:hypothetical protein D2C75_05305 [Helicobacter pylori]|uniref:hypothetical protein n=1 Tax=Helicobacter pylori TaxID=210 RepID=UPI0009A2F9F0|nr:hypothetical protein [Helicobacter pylori]MBH0301284.1 hypothetical protein [Helicobacter pylori]NHA84356.1 hypothetical protein [Helicobacter pylori]OPG26539.1 hypothetical protein BGL56_02705 [Helicobacter pylori]OPG36683.1 hypothetical protein BGL64_01845 [Helicobacter pylori]OPG37728.1 hypothetical protein BGL74_04850 [Helicobacter pylori]
MIVLKRLDKILKTSLMAGVLVSTINPLIAKQPIAISDEEFLSYIKQSDPKYFEFISRIPKGKDFLLSCKKEINANNYVFVAEQIKGKELETYHPNERNLAESSLKDYKKALNNCVEYSLDLDSGKKDNLVVSDNTLNYYFDPKNFRKKEYEKYPQACNHKIGNKPLKTRNIPYERNISYAQKKEIMEEWREDMLDCFSNLANEQSIAKYNGRVKSIEYYATHDKERKLMTEKCEEIDMQSFSSNKEPTQEQQVHCKQVKLGEYLYKERLKKRLQKQDLERRKIIIKDLAHCYVEMASSLEKGKDYLKEDKKCRDYIHISAGGGTSWGTLIPTLPYPSLLLRLKRVDKINTTQLQQCYKTFANNLLKAGDYTPLKENFLTECRNQMDTYFYEKRSFY